MERSYRPSSLNGLYSNPDPCRFLDAVFLDAGADAAAQAQVCEHVPPAAGILRHTGRGPSPIPYSKPCPICHDIRRPYLHQNSVTRIPRMFTLTDSIQGCSSTLSVQLFPHPPHHTHPTAVEFDCEFPIAGRHIMAVSELWICCAWFSS